MSRRPSARVQSGIVRNQFTSTTNSRPISARERYELGNRRKDKELRKFNEFKEAVESFKKKEFQASVYNGLSNRTNRLAEVELKEKERKANILKRKELIRELFKNDQEIYKAAKLKLSMPPEAKMSQVAIYPEVESLRLQLANLRKKNAEDREKMAEQLQSDSGFGRNYQPSRIFF